jgi:hypothetical protein
MSWALLAGGIALAVAAATAAPAAAATIGSETFKGTIVTSGVSGTRTVITSVIIAKGAFSGVGRIVEVENLPSDPDNVSRDDLVFSSGSMHLVSTNQDFNISVNPPSCVATATIHQTGEIIGGTGQFAHAAGNFISIVTGPAVLARNPDGTCSFEHVPLHEVDMISATGTLSF